MKKYLYFCAPLLIGFLLFTTGVSASCDYNLNGDIVWNLQNCLGDSDLVDPGNALIEWGIKQKFIFWTNSIASALSLVAIGAIVYGGLLMTLSIGEDEKIKKGKDVVKWALIWFLAALWAWAVVRLVIEVVFAIAK